MADDFQGLFPKPKWTGGEGPLETTPKNGQETKGTRNLRQKNRYLLGKKESTTSGKSVEAEGSHATGKSSKHSQSSGSDCTDEGEEDDDFEDGPSTQSAGGGAIGGQESVVPFMSWQTAIAVNAIDSKRSLATRGTHLLTPEEQANESARSWRASHKRLGNTPALRIENYMNSSTCTEEIINGFYLLIPGERTEAPVFQKAGVAGFWMYFAVDDTWRVGATTDMLQRRAVPSQQANLRSCVGKPGTLPDEVAGWEEPALGGIWEPAFNTFDVVGLTTAAYRSSLSDQLKADLWRAAAIQLQRTPCVRVMGAVGQWSDAINGRYKAMPGPQDQPPDYQKVDSQSYGAYCQDGTWRFGLTFDEKDGYRRKRGRAASKATKAGYLPFDTSDWSLQRDTACCDCVRIWKKAPLSFQVSQVTLAEHEANIPGGAIIKKKTTKKQAGGGQDSDDEDDGEDTKIKKLPTKREKGDVREMGLEDGAQSTVTLQDALKGFKPVKAVDAYLREEVLQIRKFSTTVGPFMNELINASVEVAADKIRNSDLLTKYEGLNPEMILAIIVFTLELQSFCFAATDDDEFYRLYNFVLRQRKPGNLRLLAGYSHYLFTGLMKLPSYEGVLWRGIRDPSAVLLALDNYKPRLKSVEWSAFSSASPDREVARQFATAEGLIFRLEVTSVARDIREVSAMPAESERLILPSTVFIVDRLAFRASDGVWEIHMVEKPQDFVF